MIVHELPGALAGERLDRVVALLGDVPRARAAEIVDGGGVEVNGAVVTQRSHRLDEGDQVAFDVPAAGGERLEPEPGIEFDVCYEDRDVLVVDKPAGLVVHPGAGHPHGTLVHGLLAGWGLRRTLEFANVAGAIVASRLECSTAMPTTYEVEAALERGGGR